MTKMREMSIENNIFLIGDLTILDLLFTVLLKGSNYE
jgi:hypothetical protein